MTKDQVIKVIYSKNWENRVQRPGFLQSKLIASMAIKQKIQLTKKVSILDKNNLWVKTSALYDKDFYNKLLNNVFPTAFREEKNWVLKILDFFDHITAKKNKFVLAMNSIKWAEANFKTKLGYFKKYLDILNKLQKYYAIAVPLADYCEKILKQKDKTLLNYATQYKSLDVDHMNESLFKIKNEGSKKQLKKLIKKHLEEFAWIKINYNIVKPYTKKEVLQEIRSHISIFKKNPLPKSNIKHIIVALQAAIYIRNRIKELSQQLWFSYEKLAGQLAKDIGISRKDFLQLSHSEVLNFLNNKRFIQPLNLQERHKGFLTGIIEGKEIILTGKIVDQLFKYFNNPEVREKNDINGMVAYKGLIKGKVCIVNNISGIGKLKKGNILVTSMTTPDFIIAMKKAGAIVTDEGGLSCHAAIVSRELQIPCVIGTKFATKVFRDGDLVEVDANKGIVRKI